MAIRAITDFSETWFTPEDQQGEDTPARFKVRQLDGLQTTALFSEMRMNGDQLALTAAGIRHAVNCGLVGWENIENEKGPLEFKKQNLKFLPGEYHSLIASEITIKSMMQDDEQKK